MRVIINMCKYSKLKAVLLIQDCFMLFFGLFYYYFGLVYFIFYSLLSSFGFKIQIEFDNSRLSDSAYQLSNNNWKYCNLMYLLPLSFPTATNTDILLENRFIMRYSFFFLFIFYNWFSIKLLKQYLCSDKYLFYTLSATNSLYTQKCTDIYFYCIMFSFSLKLKVFFFFI